MALPRLEDLDAIVNRIVADVVGDAIQYRAAGASSYSTLSAHVDYRDEVKAFDGASAMAQDIRVEMLIADVPVKPNGDVRITLPKRPGKVFKPINANYDQSGEHWAFELKDVPA